MSVTALDSGCVRGLDRREELNREVMLLLEQCFTYVRRTPVWWRWVEASIT